MFRDQLRALLGEGHAPPGLLIRRRRRGHGKGVRAAGGAPCLDRLLLDHRVGLKVAVVAEGRDRRLHFLSASACVRCNAPREMGGRAGGRAGVYTVGTSI